MIEIEICQCYYILLFLYYLIYSCPWKQSSCVFLPHCFQFFFDHFISEKKNQINPGTCYPNRYTIDSNGWEKKNNITCGWKNRQSLARIIDLCDVRIKCHAQVFLCHWFLWWKSILFLWFYWVWIAEYYLIGYKFSSYKMQVVHLCLCFILENNSELLRHFLKNHMAIISFQIRHAFVFERKVNKSNTKVSMYYWT